MSEHPLAPLPIEENWLDRPYLQWAVQNGKWLGYGALLALVVLFLVYRLLSTESAKSERDYSEIPQEIGNLGDKEKSEAALKRLEVLLAHHPETRPSYDGVIAEELLIQGKVDEAKPFIERTFQRVKPTLEKHYLSYAKTSLLLAEGQLKEALQEAHALKEDMLKAIREEKTPSFGGVLYAFNLIRIALTERELKHLPEEKKAWSELSQLSKGTHEIPISREEMNRVMTHFDDEGAKLDEFIK